jgi:uncharacterized protein (TIGR02145 family)
LPATESGTLTIFEAVNPGTITSTAGTNISICDGNTPVEFTNATPATGGNPTGADYQWQMSTNAGATWTNILSTSSPSHQHGALTATTHFRRNRINTCGDIASNVIVVTVNPLPAVPIIENTGPNSVCGGTPNGSITIAQVPGMTYSIDSINWGIGRTFSNLMHGEYRVFIRNANNCVRSTTVTVENVSGAPGLVGDSMAVAPGKTICNPFAGGTITISPNFTNQGISPTFLWSEVGGLSNIAATQNLTLTTAPTTTTTYRVRVTNIGTGCYADFDQTITVVTPPTITTQPTGGAICIGQTAITLQVAATSDQTFTYQWQSSTDSISFTNIPGATATSLQVPNNMASQLFYRAQILRTNDVCSTASTNIVRVFVHNVPSITSLTPGERCGEGAVTTLSAVANPNTANIRWFEGQTGGTPITTGLPNTGITASGTNWTTPSITTNTTYWAEAYNGTCASAWRVSVLATVATPHVITPPAANILNQAACQGATINTITFSLSGGATGTTIQWAGATPSGISLVSNAVSGTIGNAVAAATYNFTITTTPNVTGQACLPATQSGSIVVHPTPGAVSVSADNQCGQTVLTATGGAGGIIYWQDITSNGTSQTTPSLLQTVTTNGNRFFRARSDQGCWGDQGSHNVSIAQPHTLALTSAAATENQTVQAQLQTITNIVYTRGGGATAFTISWTGTANANTAPGGILVSALTGTTLTISGSPVVAGTYGFTIGTTASPATACPSATTLTGTITATLNPLLAVYCLPPNAPVSPTGAQTPTVAATGQVAFATNNPAGNNTANLGTITWGTPANTNINTNSVNIPAANGGPAQTWSGAVFVQACAIGNSANNNAYTDATVSRASVNDGVARAHYHTECRQSARSWNGRAGSTTGDLFSWCFVMRYAEQLCPAPWRVPTREDFLDLDQNLGGNRQNRSLLTNHAGDPRVTAPWGSNGWSQTQINNVLHQLTLPSGPTTDNRNAQTGGLWGGARWTGWSGNILTGRSSYWSSSSQSPTDAFNLNYNTTNVWPQNWNSKAIGLTLRCVR